MIKAMVNNMKDGVRKNLQCIKKCTMSNEDSEEVDESLTKAEIARNIVELMKKKDDDEVEEGFT